MASALYDDHHQVLNTLRQRADPWYVEWRDIGFYMCPRKSNALMGGSAGAPLAQLAGRAQTVRALHQAGERSGILLAASLQGNLTNPASKWQEMGVRPRALLQESGVQAWLDDSSLTLAESLLASNFSNEIGEWYQDLGYFGTAAMSMEALPDPAPGRFGGFLFETMNVGSYWIGEGPDGRVDTLYRQIAMPIGAAFAKWGPAIGKEWLDKIEAGKGNEIALFLRGVRPRPHWTPGAARRDQKRFEAVVFDEQYHRILDQGGFDEFPYVIGRWSKATGEEYGRGPGHQALSELKSLCKMRELALLGLAMDVAPPTFETEDALQGDLKWEPLGRNVLTAGHQVGTSVGTLGSGARHDIEQAYEERMVKTIEQYFFVDQIRALPPAETPSYMTAYEVARRYEETFRLLGPVYGRITYPGEGIGHLVERGIHCLSRAGQLLPLPDALQQQGAEMDVRYLGPLALAQESADVNAIDLELDFAIKLAQATGDTGLIPRNYHVDDVLQHRGRIRGIPAWLRTSAEEREQIKQQEAEAKQKQAAQEQAAITAKGMGDAAPALKALAGAAA